MKRRDALSEVPDATQRPSNSTETPGNPLKGDCDTFPAKELTNPVANHNPDCS